ncbi:hypothetical protein OQA88_2525 [Cercophora sp. LCS_1]
MPHDIGDWTYYFLREGSDKDAADMKHAMVLLLCEKLCLAPIKDPKRIGELGTGTGIWAIDMGDEHPEAEVVGIDLHPSQPGWTPPNVSFVLDDFENMPGGFTDDNPWCPSFRSPEYVFGRDLNLAIKDFSAVVRHAFKYATSICVGIMAYFPKLSSLTSGGWIEFQFLDHRVKSEAESFDSDHPIPRFWDLVGKGISALGFNPTTCWQGIVSEILDEQGFVDVVETAVKIPVGQWPKMKSLKLAGAYWEVISVTSAESIAQVPLSRGLKWEQDRIDEEVSCFKTAMKNHKDLHKRLMYTEYRVVYGRKPSAESQLDPKSDNVEGR